MKHRGKNLTHGFKRIEFAESACGSSLINGDFTENFRQIGVRSAESGLERARRAYRLRHEAEGQSELLLNRADVRLHCGGVARGISTRGRNGQRLSSNLPDSLLPNSQLMMKSKNCATKKDLPNSAASWDIIKG